MMKLKYLKMCVHSVVADEVRTRQARQYEETLESIEQEPASDDPADDVVSNISAQGLWQVILEELNGEDERILIYLAYVQGMKPSEISSRHRRLFPTVDDVYRIKRNVLERLRRNRRLRMLFRLILCKGKSILIKRKCSWSVVNQVLFAMRSLSPIWLERGCGLPLSNTWHVVNAVLPNW